MVCVPRRARELFLELMELLDYSTATLKDLQEYAEQVPNGTRARRWVGKHKHAGL